MRIDLKFWWLVLNWNSAMTEKQGMKFCSFSLPSILPMHLRDSGFPSCLRKRVMSLAVDVGATCKKYSPLIQNLSSGLR